MVGRSRGPSWLGGVSARTHPAPGLGRGNELCPASRKAGRAGCPRHPNAAVSRVDFGACFSQGEVLLDARGGAGRPCHGAAHARQVWPPHQPGGSGRLEPRRTKALRACGFPPVDPRARVAPHPVKGVLGSQHCRSVSGPAQGRPRRAPPLLPVVRAVRPRPVATLLVATASAQFSGVC